MVVTFHQIRLVAVAVCALVLLCQCETQRTYGEIRRGGITFDQGMWGGQGGGDDAAEIRSKFAEKGYSIGEDGTIKADKPDLFSDQKARGTDGSFDKKEAKFKKSEARTKEFRTPEYIKRQQYAGAEEARESGSTAREGDFQNSRDRDSRKLFQKRSKTSTELASFNTRSFEGGNRQFDAGGDRVGSRAIDTAPVADGTRQTAGYQDNASLSMDDVKKMVNPGHYSRVKDLE